jgi:hypothetical protein
LRELEKTFSVEKYKLKISKVKRNKEGEIIGIKLSFDSGKTYNRILERKSTEPIDNIKIFINSDKDDDNACGFEEIKNTVRVNWNDAKSLNTVEIKKSATDETIYIINGKEYTKEEMKDKIVELDGAIEMNEDEKSGKKIMIFKGNSTISDEPKTIIYLDEKIISKEEMDKIDTEIIKSVDIKKGNIKKEIKIVTKNSNGISEDTEIYIDRKKATKEELDKIEKEEIESININNNNGKKSIEIHKKNIKTISGGTWTDVNKEIKKQEIKTITTDDGDESIIFNVNKLKIPGEPTVIIENGKVDIYVNGKKLPNSESFLNLDHSKIYYLEVTDKEKTNEGIIKIKRIEVKTK